MGHVEDRLLERDLLGQRTARLAGAHGLVGHDRQRLQTRGRLEAHGLAVGTNDKAAMERRGDVIGVTLDGGRALQQVESSSNRWSAASRPATIAEALEPRPPVSGISERMRKVKSSAGCRLSKARTQRLSLPAGRPSRSRRRSCRSLTPPALGAGRGRRQDSRSRAEVCRGRGHAHDAPANHRCPSHTFFQKNDSSY